MQINPISSENTSPESLHINQVRQDQHIAGKPQKGDQPGNVKAPADENNVSTLARIMAREAEQLAQDSESRPEKAQLFRTQMEKDFSPSDGQIDAILSKILENS